MSRSGGLRTSSRRSSAGVSPVRMPTVGAWNAQRRAARPRARCPAAGPAGSSRRRRPGPAAARCRAGGCGGPCRSGGGCGDQPVDAPEERGQRLARTGGRQDQRVVAGGDGGPALGLGRGGLGERGREPRPHRRRERGERIHRRNPTGGSVTVTPRRGSRKSAVGLSGVTSGRGCASDGQRELRTAGWRRRGSVEAVLRELSRRCRSDGHPCGDRSPDRTRASVHSDTVSRSERYVRADVNTKPDGTRRGTRSSTASAEVNTTQPMRRGITDTVARSSALASRCS